MGSVDTESVAPKYISAIKMKPPCTCKRLVARGPRIKRPMTCDMAMVSVKSELAGSSRFSPTNSGMVAASAGASVAMRKVTV